MNEIYESCCICFTYFCHLLRKIIHLPVLFWSFFQLKLGRFVWAISEIPPLSEIRPVHISINLRSILINFEKRKKGILMNFDEICTSSFSSVSPKFWKFSSQRVRTRWDLAETSKNFFSEIFFDVEKLGENCIFRILSEDF